MSKAGSGVNIRQIKYWLTIIASLLLGIVIIMPIFYAFMAAFMDASTFARYPPSLFPDSFANFSNFFKVLFDSMIPRHMINSLIVATFATFVQLLLSTLAAYAIAFFNFPGKKFMFFFILGTMMIPAEVVIITNFLTINRMGLMDTYPGIMVVYFVSATQVFMFRQNFLTISTSMREAAFLDGCGDLQFYSQICIPVSKPVITSLGIASFVKVWNTYLWPLMVTNKPEMRTVQVGITLLTSLEDESRRGLVFAAIAIVLVPSLIIFAFFQRNLVHGMTQGSVKG